MTTAEHGSEREVEGTVEKGKGQAKEVAGGALHVPGLAVTGRAQGTKGER